MANVVTLTNASGGAFSTEFLIVRSNGTTGQMVPAQADTAPHAAGIVGICLGKPADSASGIVVESGPCVVQLDGAGTAGAMVYLSAATAGYGTLTAPTIAVEVGIISKVLAGNLALISLRASPMSAVTLRQAYINGAIAADQTLPLLDTDGGGILIDATLAGFTGQSALRLNSAAGTAFAINRSNGYVGISVAAPAAPLEIANSNGSSTSILLSLAAHQRIEKTGTGGLSIVVPNTGIGTNWFDVVMGTTSKIKVEPGSLGGPAGVFTLNNTGVWTGTFAHWGHGETIITQNAITSSNSTVLTLIGGAHTGLNAGDELIDVQIDLARTVQQLGGGAKPYNRTVQILAPTYATATSSTWADAATFYISGAPTAGTNVTITRGEALWIAGGGIRTDGFGASGLIKNNNGGLWTLGVAGTDFVAPWSLTNESVVVSGGGSLLVEDNAYFYYNSAHHRLHVLGQQVVHGAPGGGVPYRDLSITSAAELFDATETTGAWRDSGIYWIQDNCIGISIGGYAIANFTSQGLATYAVMARQIWGGTEFGREDADTLTLVGGSLGAATGLEIGTSSVFTATSGIQRATLFNYVGSAGGFAPTSGTAPFRAVDIAYEVNQTGGANGRTVGLNVELTRTATIGEAWGIRAGDATTSVFRTDATVNSGNAFITIGEIGTGAITGASGISLVTNVRGPALIYLDNTTNYLVLQSSGIQATALSGTGSEFVQANATGQLSRFSGVIPTALVALTGPAVVFTNGSGQLVVDTSNFVFDDTNNRLSIGASSTTARLGVAKQTGAVAVRIGGADNDTSSVALSLMNGNGAIVGHVSNQITFGYDNTETYRHVIRSMHNGAGTAGNGLDFFTWQASDGSGGLGSLAALSLTAGQVLVPSGGAVAPGLAFMAEPALGVYRVGTSIMGLSGAVDIPSLGAGGIVSAAVTTGRLGLVTIGTGLLFSGGTLSSTVTGGSPAGATGDIQYNNAGAFGAEAALHYDHTSTDKQVTIGAVSTGITGWSMLSFKTNVRQGSLYVQNSFGDGIISTVPLFAPDTGYRFTNETGIGMTRLSSGVVGMLGEVFIGDGGSAGSQWLFEVSGSATTGRDRIMLGGGGAGYTVPDNNNYFLIGTGSANVNIAKAATPLGVNFQTLKIPQNTLVATGASGTARIGTQSATVYIDGPPILSGAWSSAGFESALYVASGRVQITDELNVGGAVFNANRNGGTRLISFFGVAGTGQQVSGGTTAGVIAGLVALGLFSS